MSESFSSDGYVNLQIEFDGQSGKLYEVVWNGLKKLRSETEPEMFDLTYDSVSIGDFDVSYDKFWWNQDPWNNYGYTIWEVHFEWSNGNATWVRDR